MQLGLALPAPTTHDPDAPLVELCAGMAALSWACHGAAPPISHTGGKRSYAADARRALRIGVPRSITLVEAEPCVAAALRILWTPEARPAACDLWLSWVASEADQRERWLDITTRYRAGALGDDPMSGAEYLWVRQRSGTVRWHTWWAPQDQVVRGQRNGRRWAPESPADKITRLPSPRATVICADVRDVTPIPGAVVVIDPPYAGTVGYGSDLSRADVLAVARRWRAAGCRVAVHEQEPVMEGAHHHLRNRGRARNVADTPEWLTVLP